MRPKTLLFLAIVGLAAAASIALAQLQLPNSITWRTFRQGAFSNAGKYETMVIETEGLWQKYWANTVGGKVSETPGNIDWAKEKLVAINLGPRPNAGYELYVKSVERYRSNEIRVNVVERTPIPGMVYAQVAISPWYVIKMDREAGNITFHKETLDGGNLGNGTRIIQLGPPNDSCCTGVCRCCNRCGCQRDEDDRRNNRGGGRHGGSTGG